MFNQLRNVGLFVSLALLVTACGTVATPRYEADGIIAEANREATAIAATAAAFSRPQSEATAGPVITFEEEATEEATEEVIVEATEEATEEAVLEATEEATEEVVVEATEEATEEVVVEATEEVVVEATEEATEEAAEGDLSEEEARLRQLVSFGNAANGETIFNNGVVPSCNTCHWVDTNERLVGPGLLDIYDVAATRVEGQGAYEYLYESIRNSQAFIVPEYPAGVMPQYTEDVLSDVDIYDIMAYFETFGDE